MPSPELTVVIPCYNEAPNVAPMVERLEAALGGIAWEAIFVDDNSPDGTAQVARGIAARDPRIRCIRRVGRRGLSSACVEGMLASSASYVAVIDGDLQHDETLLPRMLAALRAGEGDVAIGSRHVAGGEAAEGFSSLRRRISDGGTTLAQFFLPVPVADPMSGFFMLPRPLAEEIAPRLTGRGFKILLDLLLSAGRKLRVVELPYTFRPRQAGESKLDATVLLDFLALLLDKWSHGLLPLRFLAFAAVGAIGIVVHLAVLSLALGPLPFAQAQWVASLVAMTANFVLNNRITYSDVRLRGAALWRGLAVFYLVCGVGVAANVGIADLLMRDELASWGLAGAAGALLTVVWNYAVSATLVWRAR
ncbi:glycosyltransferase family 2 protein [Teichococcus aestuarii]|uniref:glycosyltransferase family 2 protein n=1 Tax=Teichococcus aestuarii TaxID=568898 RepID=UPI0036063CEA